MRGRWLGASALVLCATVALLGSAGIGATWVQLQYQDRGNRYEGVKSRPVTAPDLELLCALVDYQEDMSALPRDLRIRFYLPAEADVDVAVRDLRHRTYYWMDRVRPEDPWRVGFDNIFRWPTKTVIRHLEGLGPEDLGVVVRLGPDQGALQECVAPAILFSARCPSAADGYLFAFRARAKARVSCRIYEKGCSTPLRAQSYDLVLGGMPFAFKWDAREAAESWYRLDIEGYQINDNRRISKVVDFYHRPLVGN